MPIEPFHQSIIHSFNQWAPPFPFPFVAAGAVVGRGVPLGLLKAFLTAAGMSLPK